MLSVGGLVGRFWSRLGCVLCVAVGCAGLGWGTPPGYSGAPADGGRDCTACHRGQVNSDRRGGLVIHAGSFQPGVRQKVLLTLSHPQARRWGFQLTARLARDQAKQAGTFTGSPEVAVICGPEGRKAPCQGALEFANHTALSSYRGKPGPVSWQVEWTPPAAEAGEVIFYAAGLAANNDGSAQGDWTYTAQLRVAPAADFGKQQPGAETRKVDPTWLRRRLPELSARPAEFTTASCQYKPIFGAGDPDARICRSVSRFGELVVQAGGASAPVSFAREEHAWVVLEGGGLLHYDGREQPVRAGDFFYLAPGVRHWLENDGKSACRVIVMGFRVPAGADMKPPEKLPLANIEEVPKQVVGSHPPSTLYQLLMGDRRSTRDRIAAGITLTSLFIMEFDPGGTNFPHHHEREEEIYLVLDGHGEMVAGGGMDGIEGRHPARAGDAYFFRLNCTVGFYAGNQAGEPKSRILAVRSLFPFAVR